MWLPCARVFASSRRVLRSAGIESAEQSGGEGAREGVEEEAPVEGDLFGAREALAELVEELDRAAGEREAEDGADHGKEQNFAEQLRDDGAARGAEGEAERDFALAVGGTREQQRGDVDAGDEQQEGDGAVEEPEGAADVADDDGLEGLDADVEVAVGLWKLHAELALDGGEIGERLCPGDAGLEAADDAGTRWSSGPAATGASGGPGSKRSASRSGKSEG